MARDANDNRPSIESIQTGQELRRWYWLKDELISYARLRKLKTTSGKFVILERIAHFLDTGEGDYPEDRVARATSKFDWHSAELSADTVITDNYKNTQNVRRFFAANIGDHFKFNIEFMAWIKANSGKSLGDACSEFIAMKIREAQPEFKSVIEDHNQFNQYTRDFLADNSELGTDDVRKFWALKIARPSDSGRHVYCTADLELDVAK